MKKLFMTVLMAIGFFAIAQAQAADAIYTGTFSDKAVGGYDTVSYFTEGKPVKGKSEHSTKWKDAKWLFASAENLAKFKDEPEKYAPQYGGYCAWAVTQGSLVEGDPNYWAIDNGKLYLNYNQSVQDKWFANRANFITQADEKFPSLIK